MAFKAPCTEQKRTLKTNLQFDKSCTDEEIIDTNKRDFHYLMNAEEDRTNKFIDAEICLEQGIDKKAREAQLIHTEVHSDIQYKMPEKYYVRGFSDILG